jgi:hypothetical protein
LDNSAWSELFAVYAKQAKKSTKNRERLSEIVRGHLSRDPYASETTALLLKYCRKFEVVEFDGKQLFDYLQEAWDRHFPRNYTAHLDVFIDACIEFQGPRFLRPVLEHAVQNDEINDDPEFVKLMMTVHYDVFRDLPGAIAYGRDYLRTHKKPSVETELVQFYTEAGEFTNARELHNTLRGAIDHILWMRLDSYILEHEGRFQDAIDVIESIPDRRDFDEDYTSRLSYLELKLGAASRAVKRCKEFLQERAFALSFEAEIINYEYGKKMSGKNVDPRRVANLSEVTDNPDVKGVCYSLLGEDKKALDIFRIEAEKRFSKINNFLHWPAISRHQSELRTMKEELVLRKRSLTNLENTAYEIGDSRTTAGDINMATEARMENGVRPHC